MIFGFLVVFDVAIKYIDTVSGLGHLLSEFLLDSDIDMLRQI